MLHVILKKVSLALGVGRCRDRAPCLIQPTTPEAATNALETPAERLVPEIDRRSFLRLFKESVAMAVLRETGLALAVIHLDGLAEIAQAMAPGLSEQVMSALIVRLWSADREAIGSGLPWYLGQLSDIQLALVLESDNSETISHCVENVCNNLRQPLQVAGNVFHLAPSAGVSIHGQDASTARGLLDQAQLAAAKRGGTGAAESPSSPKSSG